MKRERGIRTYPEITAQPEALQAAWEELESREAWIRRYLMQPFDQVLFIGSGSSYYQAQTMASVFRLWTGREAYAYPSSEISLFRTQNAVPGRSYLLVGVSRSGESSEVLMALEAVRMLPNWTICGITCCGDSAMARMADCLVSPLGRERSTVMTKSFSSMVFMMQVAIAKAVGRGRLLEELAEVLRQDENTVERSDRLAQELVNNHRFTNYIYLGMGSYGGISQEASLKIKEMSCVWTESFGTLEFRHGPKSIVEPGSLVVVLVSEQARSFELKVAEEMKGCGAHILLLTARAGSDTAFADHVFEVGGAHLSDEARGVLYLPMLQYMGYYTAMAKGLDPDEPRNLTQVVKI